MTDQNHVTTTEQTTEAENNARQDDNAQAVEVGASESILFPATLMHAALACASTEETRYYLNGIFFHVVEDRIRAVATDGHRLFIATQPLVGQAPAWLEQGAILHSENLAPKLKLLQKLGEDELIKIENAVNASSAYLTDAKQDARIKCPIVSGTFPDYQMIMESLTGGVTDKDDARAKDFEPVSFNGKYLKSVGDIAKLLGGKDGNVSLYAHSATEAAMATFPEYPGAMLILMPVRVKQSIAPETARLISPAVNRTLAALKAHQTRNQAWADETTDPLEKAKLSAKADEYRERIEALMARTSEKALPAPEQGGDEAIDGQPLGMELGEETTETEPETTEPETSEPETTEPAEPEQEPQPEPKAEPEAKPEPETAPAAAKAETTKAPKATKGRNNRGRKAAKAAEQAEAIAA